MTADLSIEAKLESPCKLTAMFFDPSISMLYFRTLIFNSVALIYRPLNSGERFSRNALSPSFRSSLP